MSSPFPRRHESRTSQEATRPGGEPSRLDDFLCFAIYTASHAFNRVYKPMLERLGLTYPQYIVMVTLWSGDGLTVGGIGERVMLETNTLTPLLKRLEAAGLVERRRDVTDERQVRIFLTGAGKELHRRAEAVPSEMNACLDLAPQEQAALTDEINRLRERLLARLDP